jgi:hypothetical protein
VGINYVLQVPEVEISYKDAPGIVRIMGPRITPNPSQFACHIPNSIPFSGKGHVARDLLMDALSRGTELDLTVYYRLVPGGAGSGC